jgi:hypothetical protein
LKKFINNKGKEYVVQIHHSSRNSTVIAIENLHPIGSYAIVTTHILGLGPRLRQKS